MSQFMNSPLPNNRHSISMGDLRNGPASFWDAQPEQVSKRPSGFARAKKPTAGQQFGGQQAHNLSHGAETQSPVQAEQHPMIHGHNQTNNFYITPNQQFFQQIYCGNQAVQPAQMSQANAALASQPVAFFVPYQAAPGEPLQYLQVQPSSLTPEQAAALGQQAAIQQTVGQQIAHQTPGQPVAPQIPVQQSSSAPLSRAEALRPEGFETPFSPRRAMPPAHQQEYRGQSTASHSESEGWTSVPNSSVHLSPSASPPSQIVVPPMSQMAPHVGEHGHFQMPPQHRHSIALPVGDHAHHALIQHQQRLAAEFQLHQARLEHQARLNLQLRHGSPFARNVTPVNGHSTWGEQVLMWAQQSQQGSSSSLDEFTGMKKKRRRQSREEARRARRAPRFQTPEDAPPMPLHQLSQLAVANGVNESLLRGGFPPRAKFLVVKSFHEDDVHKSIRHGVWSSTSQGNEKLQKAWEEAHDEACRLSPDGSGRNPETGRSMVPLILLFSVNKSKGFCGACEMIGPVDFDRRADFWVRRNDGRNRWCGGADVEWLVVKDVPNTVFEDLCFPGPHHRPVIFSRDATELPYAQGREFLERFLQFASPTTLLQDLAFYDEEYAHEKALRAAREGLMHGEGGAQLPWALPLGDRKRSSEEANPNHSGCSSSSGSESNEPTEGLSQAEIQDEIQEVMQEESLEWGEEATPAHAQSLEPGLHQPLPRTAMATYAQVAKSASQSPAGALKSSVPKASTS